MTSPNPRGCYLSIDLEDFKHIDSRNLGIPPITDSDGLWRGFKALSHVLSRVSGDNSLTFFTTGQVARDHPDLLKTIAGDRHEIACHGDLHESINSMTPEEFRNDLKKARHSIETVCNQQIAGFRAPNLSLNLKTEWAYKVLSEEGFAYESGLLGGKLNTAFGVKKQSPHDNINIVKLPISQKTIIPNTLRAKMGGGAFRLLPTRTIIKWMTSLHANGVIPIIYLHFSDLDPYMNGMTMNDMGELPLIQKLRLRILNTKWTLNTEHTGRKLEVILKSFPNMGQMGHLADAITS